MATSKRSAERSSVPDDKESRASVATTVAWALTTLSCGAAQIIAVVTWLIARSAGIPQGQPNALQLMPQTFIIVAVFTGLLALGMTPVVLRVRQVRPPRVITTAAIVIGLMPIFLIVVQFLIA